MTCKLTIDGREIDAEHGQTVLEAAARSGIEIPTLCHHEDLVPIGSCRLCMVEAKGWDRPAAACTLLVEEGLEVRTETPALVESRREVLELLLSDYHDAGYPVDPGKHDEFLRWVEHHGARVPDALTSKPRCEVDSDPNPFVWVDFNKCILCTRCVRACEEIQGRFVWGVGDRGGETRIVAGADTTMIDARCESCGACVAYCPTGALSDRMSMGVGAPDRLVTTTCPYCGVGCRFDLNVREERITQVTSNPEAPVNGMHLCVKGRYGYDFVHHADRLTTPLVRAELLGDGRTPGEERGTTN